jgi:uncharacterized MAPEG superfamily protein
MILNALSGQTILLGAIAVAAGSVYIPYIVVAYARWQVGYDMAAPRALFDQLPDYGKRATWAHQNSWEAFAIFTAAALMAYSTGQFSEPARWAAIVWIPARFLFSLAYILNIPPLRSLMYGIGSICSFTLMALSISSSLK